MSVYPERTGFIIRGDTRPTSPYYRHTDHPSVSASIMLYSCFFIIILSICCIIFSKDYFISLLRTQPDVIGLFQEKIT